MRETKTLRRRERQRERQGGGGRWAEWRERKKEGKMKAKR